MAAMMKQYPWYHRLRIADLETAEEQDRAGQLSTNQLLWAFDER